MSNCESSLPTPQSDAPKPQNRHRAEIVEYMNALVAERQKNADVFGDFLNHQAITGERRDELATALGISVGAEDWWDRTADEQHKVLLGKISVLRTPRSEAARPVDNAGDSDRWEDPRDLTGGETDCVAQSERGASVLDAVAWRYRISDGQPWYYCGHNPKGDVPEGWTVEPLFPAPEAPK